MNNLSKQLSVLSIAVFFLLSVLSVSLFTLDASQAQDTPQKNGDAKEAKSEHESPIDPEVLDILNKMSDNLDSLKEFSFKVVVSYDSRLNSGQMVKLGGTGEITIKRPNMIYAEFDGDRSDRKAWYNGKELTILNIDKGFYGELETPGTIDETLDYLMEEYDFTLPLADLIHTDSFEAFTESALDGVMLGTSNLGGKECSHLAFVGERIDWQLWVTEGEKPLPCKLVITYKNEELAPQYQAVFSDLNLDPKSPDSLFKAKIPDGAVKIDFINMKAQRGSE